MCFNIVSTDTSPQGSSLSYFVALFIKNSQERPYINDAMNQC